MKTNQSKPVVFARRTFLQGTAALLAAPAYAAAPPPKHQVPELAGAIGIVTASVNAQLSGRASGRRFTLLELPKILRNELDLRVLDLNTSSIPDFANVKRKYLDQLRTAAVDAGCVITNLKMNQRGIDMNSPTASVREKAIREYKRSIDIAAQLGCRWARPLPSKDKPDMAIHVESYRELCDYGKQRNVQLLVENFGWMQADSDSMVKLIQAIDRNAAAGVDTGNWNSDPLRYAGLAKSFPLAATCDFKARKLGPNGEHAAYDLKRCFDVAWRSGFRGPWCFEHANAKTSDLFRELRFLRDEIRKWTKAA